MSTPIKPQAQSAAGEAAGIPPNSSTSPDVQRLREENARMREQLDSLQREQETLIKENKQHREALQGWLRAEYCKDEKEWDLSNEEMAQARPFEEFVDKMQRLLEPSHPV
jgi:hypothetical protein